MDAAPETVKTQTITARREPKANGEPKTVRWTREQYYQMAELGFFNGKRVELIKGEIIEMTPMKSAHATAISLAAEVLQKVFGKSFVIRSQFPLSFSKTDEPEPDIAVVKGAVRDFSGSHPKIAELIVEVSDSTPRYDRTIKVGLYAQNKIREYWILNLKSRCLEVYRQPGKDKKLGFIYREIQILSEDDSVAPLAAPTAKIKIADLLP